MNATVLARPQPAADYAGFTAREFIELGDDLAASGARLELEHGTIIKMAPPKSDHSDTQSDVFLTIAAALRAAGSDLRANVEIGVVVGFDTVRVPDVVVRRREADADDLMPPGAAMLVVEIASQSLAKDLGLKARDYAGAGIPEYWVVDVQARVVHLHRNPRSDGYATRTVALFGTPMHAACLPEPIVFDG